MNRTWDEKKILAVILALAAGGAFGVNFYFAIQGFVWSALICVIVLILAYLFAVRWGKLL